MMLAALTYVKIFGYTGMKAGTTSAQWADYPGKNVSESPVSSQRADHNVNAESNAWMVLLNALFSQGC